MNTGIHDKEPKIKTKFHGQYKQKKKYKIQSGQI